MKQEKTKTNELLSYLGLEGLGRKALSTVAVSALVGLGALQYGYNSLKDIPIPPAYTQCLNLEREATRIVYEPHTIGQSIARELAGANLPNGACGQNSNRDIIQFRDYDGGEDLETKKEVYQLTQKIFEIKNDANYKKDLDEIDNKIDGPALWMLGSLIPLAIAFQTLLVGGLASIRKKLEK